MWGSLVWCRRDGTSRGRRAGRLPLGSVRTQVIQAGVDRKARPETKHHERSTMTAHICCQRTIMAGLFMEPTTISGSLDSIDDAPQTLRTGTAPGGWCLTSPARTQESRWPPGHNTAMQDRGMLDAIDDVMSVNRDTNKGQGWRRRWRSPWTPAFSARVRLRLQDQALARLQERSQIQGGGWELGGEPNREEDHDED